MPDLLYQKLLGIKNKKNPEAIENVPMTQLRKGNTKGFKQKMLNFIYTKIT